MAPQTMYLCKTSPGLFGERLFSWRCEDHIANVEILGTENPDSRFSPRRCSVCGQIPTAPISSLCSYCGWSYPASTTLTRGGQTICPDCLIFLELGQDPRPACPHCGRSLPSGNVCPCRLPDYAADPQAIDVLLESITAETTLKARLLQDLKELQQVTRKLVNTLDIFISTSK